MALGQYYYLVSSLPGLSLGTVPDLRTPAFLEHCRTLGGDDLHSRLASVSLLPDSGWMPTSAAGRGWCAWETYVRNLLVHRRASTPSQAEHWLHDEADVFPGVMRLVEDALNVGDPLAREAALDRLRWQCLNDLATGHDFDFDALVIYRLRLLLAEKTADADTDASAARLEERVIAAVEAATSQRQTDNCP